MRKRVHSKALLFFVLAIAFLACRAREKGDCYPFSCGDIRNISSPFRLPDHPKHCGYPEYNLSCDNNQTVLYLDSQKFLVKAIDYENQVIQVVDPNLHSNDCSSFQDDALLNLYYDSPYMLPSAYCPYMLPSAYYDDYGKVNATSIVFVNCSVPVTDDPSYCKANTIFFSGSSCNSISIIWGDTTIGNLHHSCPIVGEISFPIDSKRVRTDSTCAEIHDALDALKMVNLSWKAPLSCRDCIEKNYGCSLFYQQVGTATLNYSCWVYSYEDDCNKYCNLDCYNYCNQHRYEDHCHKYCSQHIPTRGFRYWVFQLLHYIFNFVSFEMEVCRGHGTLINEYYPYVTMTIPAGIVCLLLGRTIIGIICVFAFLLYKFRRRHIWMDTTVEEFLTKYRNHTPTRYSYSQIQKMTRHFEEKLGQGGYGSVYKGRLTNGQGVAIKMLSSESKGNGQEFINEVATIGRIHHINIVQLIGFCAEGSKRALIYEFMPNGSLEKYIYPQQKKTNTLSWDKMYQIALGIARGIEYLHRGCDMKILHFDIKPHNILLDENFNPKVSDFGLAKFYPTDQSFVSITAIKGTVGYIAPELFYRSAGGVSYKSDVYSFGMLLMEIAGRRRNVDKHAKDSNQIYFPLWMYDQLDQGGEMGMEDAVDDEKEIAKKLAIIGLWCIQMKPADRPSMSKVVEMLEGSVKLLQLPAKPFLSSLERVDDKNHSTESSLCIYEIGSTS